MAASSGFPFTTGRITIMNGTTVAITGADDRGPGGVGNIQMVAGGRDNADEFRSHHPPRMGPAGASRHHHEGLRDRRGLEQYCVELAHRR